MSKEALFSGKPPNSSSHRATEAFNALKIPEPTKRLTLDIPLTLHLRMKLKCVENDITIADVVRGLLEKKFPEV